MTNSVDRYRLSVKGSLSGAAAGLIDDRFGDKIRVVSQAPDTLVELSGDQAGLRSLLGLLWDLGHEVQSFLRPDTAASG